MPRSHLLVVALFLLTASGCTLKHEIARLDDMIAAVDRAITKLDLSGPFDRASDNWRAALRDLEHNLVKNGQGLLAHDLRDFVDHGVSEASDSLFKENLDYLEAKIKANLLVLRGALVEAREEMQSAKRRRDRQAIPKILEKLASTRIVLDPVVNRFIPDNLTVAWEEGTVKKEGIPSVQWIEVKGWGFDRPKGEKPLFSCYLADGNGQNRRKLPEGVIDKTTRFKIQLNLTVEGVKFERSDRKLIFVVGSGEKESFALPIIAEVKGVKKNILTGAKIEVISETPKPVGAIQVSLSHPTSNKGVMTHEFGKNVPWGKDQSFSYEENVLPAYEVKKDDKLRVWVATSGMKAPSHLQLVQGMPAVKNPGLVYRWTGRVKVWVKVNGTWSLLGETESKTWENNALLGPKSVAGGEAYYRDFVVPLGD